MNHRFHTCILTSIQLSLTLSPVVWLYGAPGWEREVECGGVSTGEEEHPNCGPQRGGVCPVPGRRCLAPGLLQRRSGERDSFLQHKRHGWEGVRICRCRWGDVKVGLSTSIYKMESVGRNYLPPVTLIIEESALYSYNTGRIKIVFFYSTHQNATIFTYAAVLHKTCPHTLMNKAGGAPLKEEHLSQIFVPQHYKDFTPAACAQCCYWQHN